MNLPPTSGTRADLAAAKETKATTDITYFYNVKYVREVRKFGEIM